ncbi:ABC transporter permease [Amycolatopsis acidiphila]|uniref:Autoinducer 2 import system permease protein LsrD n=1 Tax=Amycolatopsis acidiphila TaxID=715473 RepID=A0A558ACP7_9PSEU|nr:ABC transporter permease [Amycolatopsis acidiphila]TVT22046.1 ABC transporter permease [Amycolatopsis acidiphila]UIJ63636.1 ABC transporter permease [Amycolatopsis acidiphila]GHG67767.1 sugar ABC transporter permease [Amycolatopsis acidiphila]
MSDKGTRPAWLSRLASWDAAVIVITVVVLVIASGTVENFGTSRNFTFLLLDLLPIALVALPMTFVIVTGEIDLSVASTLGLTSAVMGDLWDKGMTIESIMPLCVVLGAVLGALNGFFVTVLKLPSLAVTIGTLALYRGLAFVVLGDNAVADFPRAYTTWVTGTIGGGPIPNLLIPLVVLALVFGLVLHATPVGRAVFAAGAGEQAARFAGIRVGRLKFWLYVVSGAVAGLAGVLWTLRYSSARADNGSGLELAVVAAVLLGGVSIFGGKGTLPGVLAGVVLLGTLQNALRLQDVSNEALNIVTGALLIISVLLPNIVTRTRAHLGRRATT